MSWAALSLPSAKYLPCLGGSSFSQEHSAIAALHYQLGRPEFLLGEQLALINTQLEDCYSIIANQ